MLVFIERWFVRLARFSEVCSFSLYAVLLIPSSVMSDSKRKKRQYSTSLLTSSRRSATASKPSTEAT
ncbi:hypothetical protein M514_19854 [Trichuris suis]|uniref:Uncharacterized protein n=1 Tax=Trichuris suis TaxID=68888 RepID=A0A085NET1_9BILA|nr:hypothetical protein M514_19854 [Trichuris suis]